MSRRPRPIIGRHLDLAAGWVHVREDGRLDHKGGDDPRYAGAVLLLHGFGSSMHAFDRLTPLVADAGWVIRLDLLGHGATVGRDDDVHPPKQAAMATEVLAALGARDVTVVGHSFGADVAIELARRDPAARRVVVVGQAPDYTSARLPRGSALLRRPWLAARLTRWSPRWAVNRSARFAFAPGADFTQLTDRPDRVALDVRATSPAAYPAVLVDRPPDLAERPLDQRLRDWGGPTLVLLGAQDQLYPVGPTRQRYAAVPTARVEVLDGSGHSPVLEQPEETARLIVDFAR